MLKKEFIELLKDIGFKESNGIHGEPNFSMETDISGNPNSLHHSAFADRISVNFIGGGVTFSLTVTRFRSNMMGGETLGYFTISEFYDKKVLHIFLYGVAACFNNIPVSILKYLRNDKLDTILE
jgi:hypothetical protein